MIANGLQDETSVGVSLEAEEIIEILDNPRHRTWREGKLSQKRTTCYDSCGKTLFIISALLCHFCLRISLVNVIQIIQDHTKRLQLLSHIGEMDLAR